MSMLIALSISDDVHNVQNMKLTFSHLTKKLLCAVAKNFTNGYTTSEQKG